MRTLRYEDGELKREKIGDARFSNRRDKATDDTDDSDYETFVNASFTSTNASELLVF
jgi:hypothetical protein